MTTEQETKTIQNNFSHHVQQESGIKDQSQNTGL